MTAVTVYDKGTGKVIKKALYDDYVAATKRFYEYKELYPKAKVEIKVYHG